MQMRVNTSLLAILGAAVLLCAVIASCLVGGYGYLQLRPLPTPTLSLVESVRATATAQALVAAREPTSTSTPTTTLEPTPMETVVAMIETPVAVPTETTTSEHPGAPAHGYESIHWPTTAREYAAATITGLVPGREEHQPHSGTLPAVGPSQRHNHHVGDRGRGEQCRGVWVDGSIWIHGHRLRFYGAPRGDCDGAKRLYGVSLSGAEQLSGL
jgi:hypothetical protein